MVVRPDSPDPATTSLAENTTSPLENPQQISGAATDAALRDVCAQIFERLGRLEAAVQRTEGFVAERPWDLSTIAYKRLERVDETLRAVQRSIDDSTLPEMCVNIERQIVQTRAALQRPEQAAPDDSVRQLWHDIDARLVRTEQSLQRTEGSVAGWLRGAEESIRRMERIVSSRTSEPPASLPPAVAVDPGSRSNANRSPIQLPVVWRTYRHELVAAALVVATLAIGVLFWADRGTSGERAAAPMPPSAAPTPSATPAATRNVSFTPPAVEARRETPVASPAAKVSSRAPDTQITAPRRASLDQPRAVAPSAPPIFVGTLAINSVPSGAAVSINGKAAGVTPLRLPRQRAGSMAVQIAQDGFERWSAAVRVPADQLTQVTARLRPLAQ